MPLRERSIYRLNALLCFHSHGVKPAAALSLFQKMRAFGIPLDSYSFPPVLSACSAAPPSLGRGLHALMAKAGCLSSPITSTALLHMYSVSGRIEDAISVFDEMPARDAVAWNALISSLPPADAVDAFRSMAASGVRFTGFTLCSLLKALAALRALRQGKQIHALATVAGGDDSPVMATALIDLYSSCAQLGAAAEVFNRLECPKDSAIRNAAANACVKNGRFGEALAMAARTRHPDETILTTALSACALSLNLGCGRETHCAVLRRGVGLDSIPRNALVNMYAKCGDLKSALLAFGHGRGRRDVVSWTSAIDACGAHGRGDEALRLLRRMEEEEKDGPNAATFLAALSACSHSGLVDEAKECFLLMKEKRDVVPGPAHYACLIDLLGRAGRVEEAWDLFCGFDAESGELSRGVCVAMLNACRIGLDFRRGEIAAARLLEADSENPSSYVQVSNFYGAFGKWKGVEELRQLVNFRGLKKELGCSFIVAS